MLLAFTTYIPLKISGCLIFIQYVMFKLSRSVQSINVNIRYIASLRFIVYDRRRVIEMFLLGHA